MKYRVLITSGKKGNFASMGSIGLSDKNKVVNYIKRNPMNRNAKTQIFYGKKIIATGKKSDFWSSKKF